MSGKPNRRRASKVAAMPLEERILEVLPRMGLASGAQIQHLAKTYPKGGYDAMQAIFNLMSTGVRDVLAWQRDITKPEAICSVTSQYGDTMELKEPVALPPTAACTLHDTELCVEKVMTQLCESIDNITFEALESKEPVKDMAKEKPSQICQLVQRVRFTEKLDRAMMSSSTVAAEGTIKGSFMKELKDSRAAIASQLRLPETECPPEERGDLQALQILFEEQLSCLNEVLETKDLEKMQEKVKEMVRVYYNKDDRKITLNHSGMTVPVATNVYAPGPPPLVTTEFTDTLRLEFIRTMTERERVLVLVGNNGAGKTHMLEDVGRLLGTLPTTIKASEDLPADEKWWLRRFHASLSGTGGALTPFILSQAHKASEAALEVALKVAAEQAVCLCVTMIHGEKTESLKKGLFAGHYTINVRDPDMSVIAKGLLAAEGVEAAETLAPICEKVLAKLEKECSKRRHYDFGPRTLAQICGQVGNEIRTRAKKEDPKAVLATIMQRCLLPKLLRKDVEKVFESAIKEIGVTLPPQTYDDRWAKVVENIDSITDCEPDCMILPCTENHCSGFFQAFDRHLNANMHQKVELAGILADYDPEELLGKTLREGEDVEDGVLVKLIRKAQQDFAESEKVWMVFRTGDLKESHWFALRELLNDSGVLNLPTGEQLRLPENLRYLFILPNQGETSRDTFSRSAIVWTHPPWSVGEKREEHGDDHHGDE